MKAYNEIFNFGNGSMGSNGAYGQAKRDFQRMQECEEANIQKRYYREKNKFKSQWILRRFDKKITRLGNTLKKLETERKFLTEREAKGEVSTGSKMSFHKGWREC